MTLNVAGQSATLTAASPLYSQNSDKIQDFQIDGNRLVVNKDSLRSKIAAAPIGTAEEQESLLKRLINAIRAFVRSVINLFRSGPARVAVQSDSIGGAPGASLGSYMDDAPGTPKLSEDEGELVVDGLPEPVLARVQKTLSEMIDSAMGQHLPESLRAALKMPELGQKQAFRVLLQKNCMETKEMRGLCESLRTSIHELLVPFAEKYQLDPAGALAVFRADLEGGGGVLTKVVDPNGELRTHVAELKRLESALAGHARARGAICAAAFENEVYGVPDLKLLLDEQGIESDFLDQFEPGFELGAEVKEGLGETQDVDAAGENVVSMEAFRSRRNASAPAEIAAPEIVFTVLDQLEKQNVIATEDKGELAAAVTQDQLLSAEQVFDEPVDVAGDDLGDFVSKRNAPKIK